MRSHEPLFVGSARGRFGFATRPARDRRDSRTLASQLTQHASGTPLVFISLRARPTSSLVRLGSQQSGSTKLTTIKLA